MTAEDVERLVSLKSLKMGRMTPGDNMTNTINEIPAWVDKRKIERAKEIYQEYSTSINFGHLSGLMMIFLYTKHIEPFLFTGQSSNFVALLRRYISTAHHVRKWYMGDILNPDDEAHKSLMVVKKMHKNVAQKMKAAYHTEDFIHVSQFSMAMTQFAFVGIIALFPERLGIRFSKEDMESFLHFWRCIGYFLGMDENYNICAGNHKETISLFRDILDEEIKPGIKTPRQESVSMARDIITVFGCFTPLLSWQSLCEYWADSLAIPRNFNLSLYDKISVLWFNFTFGFLMWYQWIRYLLNRRSIRHFNHVLSDMPYYENLVLNYETKLSSKMAKNR